MIAWKIIIYFPVKIYYSNLRHSIIVLFEKKTDFLGAFLENFETIAKKNIWFS